MKFSRYLLFLLTVLCHTLFAEKEAKHPEIVSYIEEHLPLFGTLNRIENFIYVDLDDDYIHRLLPFIEADGFQTPPYFGRSDLVGAHITIAYPDEVEKYLLKEIEECGTPIQFFPQECQVVYPQRWEGIREAYLVIVESPQLDLIREKYGLPPKKYSFHITIGVLPK